MPILILIWHQQTGNGPAPKNTPVPDKIVFTHQFGSSSFPIVKPKCSEIWRTEMCNNKKHFRAIPLKNVGGGETPPPPKKRGGGGGGGRRKKEGARGSADDPPLFF